MRERERKKNKNIELGTKSFNYHICINTLIMRAIALYIAVENNPSFNIK